MHRVRVVDLAFSADDAYLASLGGNEDGNRIIVWEMSTGAPKREQPTRGATTLEWFRNDPEKFAAVGKTKDAFVLYDVHGGADGNVSQSLYTTLAHESITAILYWFPIAFL